MAMNNGKAQNEHASGADEFEQDVQRRCQAQMPDDELAAKFECSEESLKQRFGARLELWRKQGRAQARQELFWAACSGKISALMFFLKSYCGLGSPPPQVEPEDPVRRYAISLRQMTNAELDAEKERHRLASGTPIEGEAGAEGAGGETPRSAELT